NAEVSSAAELPKRGFDDEIRPNSPGWITGIFLMTRSLKYSFAVVLCLVSIFAIGKLLKADVPSVPSNTWAATSDLAQERAGAASALLYNGYVLVTGGTDATGAVTKTAERYSPAAQGYLATPDMPTARANHSATLLPDGRVLVAGGVDANGHAIA